jgi:chromate transporter
LQDAIVRPPASLAKIFVTWLTLGVQSFGGGTSTFYMINEACLRNGWTTEAEFVRAWGLVQISPGINLVKLTALIGYQLRGWPGLTAAMTGLLVPSALITIAMTAAFAVIRDNPVVKAAMRGILPATVGLSLAMGVQMASPLVAQGRREGRPRLAIHVTVLAAAAALLMAGSSPLVVLIAAGGVTVLLLAVVPANRAAPGTGVKPANREDAAAGAEPR